MKHNLEVRDPMKRIVSFIMAVATVFTMMPVDAYALNGKVTNKEHSAEFEQIEITPRLDCSKVKEKGTYNDFSGRGGSDIESGYNNVPKSYSVSSGHWTDYYSFEYINYSKYDEKDDHYKITGINYHINFDSNSKKILNPNGDLWWKTSSISGNVDAPNDSGENNVNLLTVSGKLDKLPELSNYKLAFTDLAEQYKCSWKEKWTMVTHHSYSYYYPASGTPGTPSYSPASSGSGTYPDVETEIRHNRSKIVSGRKLTTGNSNISKHPVNFYPAVTGYDKNGKKKYDKSVPSQIVGHADNGDNDPLTTQTLDDASDSDKTDVTDGEDHYRRYTGKTNKIYTNELRTQKGWAKFAEMVHRYKAVEVVRSSNDNTGVVKVSKDNYRCIRTNGKACWSYVDEKTGTVKKTILNKGKLPKNAYFKETDRGTVSDKPQYIIIDPDVTIDGQYLEDNQVFLLNTSSSDVTVCGGGSIINYSTPILNGHADAADIADGNIKGVLHVSGCTVAGMHSGICNAQGSKLTIDNEYGTTKIVGNNGTYSRASSQNKDTRLSEGVECNGITNAMSVGNATNELTVDGTEHDETVYVSGKGNGIYNDSGSKITLKGKKVSGNYDVKVFSRFEDAIDTRSNKNNTITNVQIGRNIETKDQAGISYDEKKGEYLLHNTDIDVAAKGHKYRVAKTVEDAVKKFSCKSGVVNGQESYVWGLYYAVVRDIQKTNSNTRVNEDVGNDYDKDAKVDLNNVDIFCRADTIRSEDLTGNFVKTTNPRGVENAGIMNLKGDINIISLAGFVGANAKRINNSDENINTAVSKASGIVNRGILNATDNLDVDTSGSAFVSEPVSRNAYTNLHIIKELKNGKKWSDYSLKEIESIARKNNYHYHDKVSVSNSHGWDTYYDPHMTINCDKLKVTGDTHAVKNNAGTINITGHGNTVLNSSVDTVVDNGHLAKYYMSANGKYELTHDSEPLGILYKNKDNAVPNTTYKAKTTLKNVTLSTKLLTNYAVRNEFVGELVLDDVKVGNCNNGINNKGHLILKGDKTDITSSNIDITNSAYTDFYRYNGVKKHDETDNQIVMNNLLEIPNGEKVNIHDGQIGIQNLEYSRAIYGNSAKITGTTRYGVEQRGVFVMMKGSKVGSANATDGEAIYLMRFSEANKEYKEKKNNDKKNPADINWDKYVKDNNGAVDGRHYLYMAVPESNKGTGVYTADDWKAGLSSSKMKIYLMPSDSKKDDDAKSEDNLGRTVARAVYESYDGVKDRLEKNLSLEVEGDNKNPSLMSETTGSGIIDKDKEYNNIKDAYVQPKVTGIADCFELTNNKLDGTHISLLRAARKTGNKLSNEVDDTVERKNSEGNNLKKGGKLGDVVLSAVYTVSYKKNLPKDTLNVTKKAKKTDASKTTTTFIWKEGHVFDTGVDTDDDYPDNTSSFKSPTDTGLKQLMWMYKDENGNAKTVKDKDVKLGLSQDRTYYAIWNTDYNIRFYGNGNTNHQDDDEYGAYTIKSSKLRTGKWKHTSSEDTKKKVTDFILQFPENNGPAQNKDNYFVKALIEDYYDKNLQKTVKRNALYSFQGWSLSQKSDYTDDDIIIPAYSTYDIPSVKKVSDDKDISPDLAFLMEAIETGNYDSTTNTVKVYAVWDKYPELQAYDSYVYDRELKGKDAEKKLKEKLLSQDKVTAKDFEDGSLPQNTIKVGTRIDKNGNLVFGLNDLTNLGDNGVATLYYSVEDKPGVVKRTIGKKETKYPIVNKTYYTAYIHILTDNGEDTIDITDGSQNPDGEKTPGGTYSSTKNNSKIYVRLIDKANLAKDNHKDGGLEKNSIWRTPAYSTVLKSATDDIAKLMSNNDISESAQTTLNNDYRSKYEKGKKSTYNLTRWFSAKSKKMREDYLKEETYKDGESSYIYTGEDVRNAQKYINDTKSSKYVGYGKNLREDGLATFYDNVMSPAEQYENERGMKITRLRVNTYLASARVHWDLDSDADIITVSYKRTVDAPTDVENTEGKAGGKIVLNRDKAISDSDRYDANGKVRSYDRTKTSVVLSGLTPGATYDVEVTMQYNASNKGKGTVKYGTTFKTKGLSVPNVWVEDTDSNSTSKDNSEYDEAVVTGGDKDKNGYKAASEDNLDDPESYDKGQHGAEDGKEPYKNGARIKDSTSDGKEKNAVKVHFTTDGLADRYYIQRRKYSATNGTGGWVNIAKINKDAYSVLVDEDDKENQNYNGVNYSAPDMPDGITDTSSKDENNQNKYYYMEHDEAVFLDRLDKKDSPSDIPVKNGGVYQYRVIAIGHETPADGAAGQAAINKAATHSVVSDYAEAGYLPEVKDVKVVKDNRSLTVYWKPVTNADEYEITYAKTVKYDKNELNESPLKGKEANTAYVKGKLERTGDYKGYLKASLENVIDDELSEDKSTLTDKYGYELNDKDMTDYTLYDVRVQAIAYGELYAGHKEYSRRPYNADDKSDRVGAQDADSTYYKLVPETNTQLEDLVNLIDGSDSVKQRVKNSKSGDMAISSKALDEYKSAPERSVYTGSSHEIVRQRTAFLERPATYDKKNSSNGLDLHESYDTYSSGEKADANEVVENSKKKKGSEYDFGRINASNDSDGYSKALNKKEKGQKSSEIERDVKSVINIRSDSNGKVNFLMWRKPADGKVDHYDIYRWRKLNGKYVNDDDTVRDSKDEDATPVFSGKPSDDYDPNVTASDLSEVTYTEKDDGDKKEQTEDINEGGQSGEKDSASSGNNQSQKKQNYILFRDIMPDDAKTGEYVYVVRAVYYKSGRSELSQEQAESKKHVDGNDDSKGTNTECKAKFSDKQKDPTAVCLDSKSVSITYVGIYDVNNRDFDFEELNNDPAVAGYGKYKNGDKYVDGYMLERGYYTTENQDTTLQQIRQSVLRLTWNNRNKDGVAGYVAFMRTLNNTGEIHFDKDNYNVNNVKERTIWLDKDSSEADVDNYLLGDIPLLTQQHSRFELSEDNYQGISHEDNHQTAFERNEDIESYLIPTITSVKNVRKDDKFKKDQKNIIIVPYYVSSNGKVHYGIIKINDSYYQVVKDKENGGMMVDKIVTDINKVSEVTETEDDDYDETLIDISEEPELYDNDYNIEQDEGIDDIDYSDAIDDADDGSQYDDDDDNEAAEGE